MSPVIGAILMVAITVIMAAAIGTLVLDVGAGEPTPSATVAVTADADTDELTLVHRGGDGLDAARTRLIVEDAAGDDGLSLGPTTNRSVLGVGDVVTLDVDAGNVTSSTWGAIGPEGGFAVDPGDRVVVRLVDTESKRLVFETTVSA